MVQANPDAFKDKKVIWGGIILSSKNLADKSVIEVLQTPLDRADRATEIEKSQGRFLTESSQYLDTFLYKAGKEITVAGIIKGIATEKIGERDYAYPILEPLQMRVFEPYKEPVYEPSPLITILTYTNPLFIHPLTKGGSGEFKALQLLL